MKSCDDFESTTNICKFNVGQTQPLYAKIKWKPNETDIFCIQIFDGVYSWSGKFSTKCRDQFMEETLEEKDLYTANLYSCLNGEDSSYTFTFNTESSSVACFEWTKKCYAAELVHGAVKVLRDSVQDSKDSFIDYLLSVNNNLKKEVNKYKQRSKSLEGELEEHKNRIVSYIEEKKTLETVLYGKFVKLLNTKKDRIQFLEDTMQKIEES